MTAPVREEEWGKKIFSALIAGRTLQVIDNITAHVRSPSFAALLPTPLFQDRVLGKSVMPTLPHKMFWIGSGNNVQLAGDIPRRSFIAKLNADDPRPWQRDPSKWKHPELLKWIKVNRTRILSAILTLTRAWILAGVPNELNPKPHYPLPDKDVPRMASFEEWREIIGGILCYHKFGQFLGNMEELYKDSDIELTQWELFFERWHDRWGEAGVTVAQLIAALKKDDEKSHQVQQKISSADPQYACTNDDNDDAQSLIEVLPEDLLEAWTGKKFSHTLGTRLRDMKGRTFVNGLKFEKVDDVKKHHAVAWRVVSKKPQQNNQDGGST
jgi:hypothetical protein